VEGEYGGNITYSCMKMKKGLAETILRKRGGWIKKNDGGSEFN
jgi:hypothetical protein